MPRHLISDAHEGTYCSTSPWCSWIMITRNRIKRNLQSNDVAASQPLAPEPVALPTRADGAGVPVKPRSKVGIHAVTQHAQMSNESQLRRTDGQSGEYPARQGRVGLWSDKEVEELRRLVNSNIDSKGVISWNRVEESWKLLKLSVRTKASLSSKWRDIKSRVHLLDSADNQDNVVQSGTPGTGNQQQHLLIADPASEVNIAVLTITPTTTTTTTTMAAAAAPDPGDDNPPLAPAGEDPETDDIKKIFFKYLKKSRKIGCDNIRKAPSRVTPNSLTQSIMDKVDLLLKEEVDQRMKGDPSWNQLSILVYAGALTVDEICNRSSREKQTRSKVWFRSTYEEIDKLRKTIGKGSAELARRKNAEVAPTVQQLINIRLLKKKYKCKTFDEITSLVERLKCRLKLLLARVELRKEDEERSRVRHRPAKFLFRDKVSQDSTDTVNIQKIRQYWKNIVGVKKSFDHKNDMLNNWKQSLPENPTDEDLSNQFTEEVWNSVVSKIKPWKAPGPDGIQSYWWKTFKTANASLHRLVKSHLTSGIPLPQKWISSGRIILLFKSGDRSDPANYRPIACLNTCYKLLTGFIAAYLNKYVTERSLLVNEQRALQKSVWGCTHALIIDQTIIADAFNQKKRPISVGWIDYAKAFDSVPHSYIKWLLKVMRVPEPLRKFLDGLMNSWKVTYEAKDLSGKTERSSYLRIRSGVLQGDSFSPLLFCLAMVPISHALNSTNSGYKIAAQKSKEHLPGLSHQFYMDDLKLYANSEKNLGKLLLTVEQISSAISMKINRKKCAVAHFVPQKGRLKRAKNTSSDPSKAIKEMLVVEGGKHYKYLGMEQEFNTNESITWDMVKDKCTKKFKKIWASNLTFRQKVDTYNNTIIPALTYVSGNIVRGKDRYNEVTKAGEDLDVEFRGILAEERARYQKASTDRLYLSVERGGYGMKSIKNAIEESTIYLWAYLCTRADLKASHLLFSEYKNRDKRSVLSDAAKVLRAYNIEASEEEAPPTVIIGGVRYEKTLKLAQHVVGLMRRFNDNKRYGEWKKLKLAGRVLCPNQPIDLESSFQWLIKGRLSSTAVRNVIAVQEGCLLTNAHPGSGKTGKGKRCRKCGASQETIEHVVSCCSKWLTTLYIDRHDSVARNVHYILCKRYELTPPHYTQRVAPVLENDNVRLYWNQPVQTRTVIKHNKPNLVVFDKVKKTALIIELAVSWFTGIVRQKEIKINRYCVNGNYEDVLKLPYPGGDNLVKELSTSGWEVSFLPIVIGTNGEVLVGLKEELKEKLAINNKAALTLIERLQRSAVLGTSRVVQNHLALKKYLR